MLVHGLLIHEIRSGGHDHAQTERQRKQIQQPGTSVGQDAPHGGSGHQAAEIDPGPHKQHQVGSLVRLLAHALSVGGLCEQVADGDLHLGDEQTHRSHRHTRIRGEEVSQGCASSHTHSQDVRGLPVPHDGHHVAEHPENRLHAPREPRDGAINLHLGAWHPHVPVDPFHGGVHEGPHESLHEPLGGGKHNEVPRSKGHLETLQPSQPSLRDQGHLRQSIGNVVVLLHRLALPPCWSGL
mmetsp:Transcript_23231/g.56530  ORF Transcript_23231/g.56530 Transcript_23231/m.56530 type:complete len:239 (-) Transcript_23231:72-788(-)